MNERTESQTPFQIGERVKVISGPFQDFGVKVASVDEPKERVRVLVPWDPRELKDGQYVRLYERPQELMVELDFCQIDRSL